ncbi:MAG: Maf family protein [Roseburia sp.]|nr:Maf family protein [Roseburia sp.]
MIKYVLASGSPRRRELLKQMELPFEVSPAHGEEVITRELPWEIVEELSYQKAAEEAERYMKENGAPDGSDTVVIIGADTIVAYGKEIMGKPKNMEDAVRMLTTLQNNTHQVYTGVTLILLSAGGKVSRDAWDTVTFHEKTDVSMYPMSPAQIRAYVATGEPADKAGAYAIQGKCAAYIKGINGDYNNVVGLPVARLMQELFSRNLIG